jgi:putative PIN family toxin of toxin-antitoxin system
MSDLTRAVFDCNVFLQALAAPGGPAGRCVQRALDGQIELVTSPAVLNELRDVAARPRIAAKLRLTPERVLAFITAVEIVAMSVDAVPEPFAFARDPDDAHYVNLALASGATVLVTRDRDLLSLADVTTAEGADFRRRFRELRVLDPVLFLRELEAGKASGTA